MKLNNAASLPVKLLRYLLMAFVLLISLYPIAWVLINSFKQTPGGLGFPENGCSTDILRSSQSSTSDATSQTA